MTSDEATRSRPVTVLGTGAMGSAIARTLLGRGHPVTVWNRTRGRAQPLVEGGARGESSVAGAVARSPLVVLCLVGQDAAGEVLAQAGDAVADRVLVDVSSGSPERARRAARWASAHEADYLDGAIMADPTDLGTPRARLSFSGSRAAFEKHETTLRGLGTATYFGTDHGHAAVELLAQVGVGYELLIGFLHTVRLVQAEGADVAAFAERFADSLAVGYPDVVRAMGKAVRDGEYPPDLGPLSVQAALMDDLVEHRRSLGVDTTRMVEVRQLMRERVAAGHGDQGFAGLFPLLASDGITR